MVERPKSSDELDMTDKIIEEVKQQKITGFEVGGTTFCITFDTSVEQKLNFVISQDEHGVTLSINPYTPHKTILMTDFAVKKIVEYMQKISEATKAMPSGLVGGYVLKYPIEHFENN